MNTHRIHRVAKLTGLSKDVLRVWERRYGLVRPARGPNRYRLYTDEDVQLLRYLKHELDQGARIGDLASLGREALQGRAHQRAGAPETAATSARLLEQLLATLAPLDRAEFERRLNGAVAVIPFEEALNGILLPLQARVGELWHEGRLSIATEHFVTMHVRQKIFAAMNQTPSREQGPNVVVACGPGDTHEVGAQAVAYRCKQEGCRVYYLGPTLPLDELVRFCREVKPQLVLLSLTLPPSEEQAMALGRELKAGLGSQCPVIVGGAGALAVRSLLERQRIRVLADAGELATYLAREFGVDPPQAWANGWGLRPPR